MRLKHFTLYCFAMLLSAKSNAQNVSSPYSILGIGDIETNDYGRYNASGSAAVSRREEGYYNFSNPASLTVMLLKEINLNLVMRGRVSKFKLSGTDTITSPSKDMVMKRITIAFKVTPTVAFAFGLKPFSSSNYQFAAISSFESSASIYKYTDGSGGINQTYFSIAKEIKKGLSLGATASWLFGSLQNSILYFNQSLDLDILRKVYNFYNAAGLQGGMQYYTEAGKKWQQTLALTATAYTTLKGQKTGEYIENTTSTTLKTLVPENIQFKLPVTISAGYSIAKNTGISYHLQGTYNKWPTQKVDYKNSYTKDAFGINVGMEYSKKMPPTIYGTKEKYYLACGLKMEQYYLVINNQRLNDYAVTFGGGMNLSRFLSATSSIEVGRKGNASLNQIQENYFQYSIGFTLKDIWLGTKKYGRYN